MVQRTVSVGLVANVSNYVANMRLAEQATRKTAAAAVGSEKQLQAMGEVQTRVGQGMLAAGAVGAAGLALVIKKTADFGARMAQLQTVTKASQTDMKRLADDAMKAGQAYGYSASEVADAQIELAKAGLTTTQILGGGLKGALSLAAAGQMDVGEATSIAVTAMTQFGLKAKDIPRISDLLASGADKSTASVASLGEALKQSGLVANQMGWSVDETVGVLTAFANAGLQGSDAGTSLKSAMLALATPTRQQSEIMNDLGFSVYDASGKFVNASTLAGRLQKSFGGLDAEARNSALGVIFGSDAIRTANVLYENGAKKIQGYIDANRKLGFANAQAAGKMNSLSGDVQKLSAAFDTNLIKAGTGANDALRGIVQTGSKLLDVVGDIPAPVASAGVALTAAATGVTLLGGAALIAVPKIMTFRRTMAEAGVSGKRMAATFGKGGLVVAGITAVGAGLANLSTSGTANTQQLALAAGQLAGEWKHVDDVFSHSGVDSSFSSLITGGKGAKAALEQLTGGPVQQLNRVAANMIDGITGITGVGTHLGDVFKSNAQTFDAIAQQLGGLAGQDLPSAQRSFQQLNAQLGGTQDSARAALSQMTPYRDALAEVAQKADVQASSENLLAIAQGRGAAAAKVAAYQQREAAASAKEHASALQVLAGGADDGTSSVKALTAAIQGLDGGQVGVSNSIIAMEQAIDDAAAAAKKGARGIDLNTAAGRENQSALNQVVETTKAAAQAMNDNGRSSEAVAKRIARGRAEFVRQATAMTGSKKKANELADAYFRIPKTVKTKVGVTGIDPAVSRADVLAGKLNTLVGRTWTVNLRFAQSGSPNDSGLTGSYNARRAGGGPIWGSGAKGVDSVPIVAAPGEHMVTASEVDAVGGQSSMYAIRAAMRNGTLTGYAGGGAIDDAKKSGSTAKRDAAKYAKQLKAAQRAEKAADKAYDAIDGKAVHRPAKQAAKRRLEAAQKRVADLEKKLGKAKDTQSASGEKAAKLREDREDFVSRERRGDVDPLSYVDQLRSMSRDENFSASRRKKFGDRANEYERAIVEMTKASAEAAQKLDELKQSSKQMAESITGSIAGRYQASSADSVQTTSGWTVQDGIEFQTTTSALSAASIDSYYGKSATDTETFASQLDQLRARGVDGRLLAEIAADPNGPALAAAMLGGSDGQIASINRNYGRIQTAAGAAGQTVADTNYAALIADAQANADRITKQLDSDSQKLRKLIADAFGLPGYASGTPSAATGLRRVAENGAELVTQAGYRIFGGGEQVMNARNTAFIRGGGWAGSGGAARGGEAPVWRMPDRIVVEDLHGFRAEMRVVAKQEIHTNAAQGAVAWVGGAV